MGQGITLRSIWKHCESVDEGRKHLPSFFRGTGRSPEAGLLMSEMLSDQRLQGEMGKHGLQVGTCISPYPSVDFISQRMMSVLWEHVEESRQLCVVMSPTHGRLLDLAVEIATAQMWNGRHFVCITSTSSSLSHARSLTALRSVRGVHAAIADGCTFGCRCNVASHFVTAGWQFVTTLPSLARKMQRRVPEVIFTCSELRVSRCLYECEEPS